ncbi:MAG: response regulator [Chromatiales bacterium]|nr:response regulator [Chromatiales bacterium]
MDNKIKVLIVDDATFMVKALRDILDSDHEIEVIGSARNGKDAVEKIKKLKPDVITLDVDMPVMDGIQAVRHIMIECPVPIVMLSSLFAHGDITFEALRLGVVDFLPKPSGAISTDIHTQRTELVDRVKLASSIKLENVHRVKLHKVDSRENLGSRYQYQSLDYLISIGTTLGGPGSIIRLLSSLPQDIPAAIVAMQDIQPKIIPEFVNQFDQFSSWKIEEGIGDIVLQQGTCYICSTRVPMVVDVNENNEPMLRQGESSQAPLNTLFSTAAELFEGHTVGVLMTGHGDDGKEGFAEIQRLGGVTLAQETSTCVYPNLTQCAIESGVVDRIVTVSDLASHLIDVVKQSAGSGVA